MTHVQSAIATADRSALADVCSRGDQLIGFGIIAVAPTVFWTAAAVLLAPAVGFELSPLATAVFASAVFGFLVCIWASFAIADRRRTANPE